MLELLYPAGLLCLLSSSDRIILCLCSVKDTAINRDRYHLPGNKLSAVLQSLLRGHFQPAAAGDLHADDRHALNIVGADDLGQLFRIVHTVQLGAAHKGNLAPDKLLMEIGVGVGGAVCRNQQFGGCSPAEIERMFGRLEYTTHAYQKDEMIYSCGKVVTEIGIVLSGSVQIENDDVWGNRSILSVVGQGGIFAEAYACVPNVPLMVNVIANDSCEILFLNMAKIFGADENRCPWLYAMLAELS